MSTVDIREAIQDRTSEAAAARAERHFSDSKRLRKLLAAREQDDSGTVTIAQVEKAGITVVPLPDLSSADGNMMVILSTLASSMRRALPDGCIMRAQSKRAPSALWLA